MSLLTRIACSNGNKQRKTQANLIIGTLDQPKVAQWNKYLKAEIRRKSLKRSLLPVKY